MGRGRSKLGAGGATGSLSLGNGNTAEFEGTLIYGGKDKTLTKEERAEVEAWEKKRANSEIEYMYAVTDYGIALPDGEIMGDERHVEVPDGYTDWLGSTLTHIHPRTGEEKNQLGGTFSRGDLDAFTWARFETLRAVANEGVYSISKTPDFSASGFQRYARQTRLELWKKYEDARAKIDSRYERGITSDREYRAEVDKSFNTFHVELHKALVDGQKKFGYIYTLERR